jgi:outer membrane protein
MKKLRLFLLVACLMGVAAEASAGPVGYVDVNKILKDSPQAIESANKLKNEFKARSDEIDQMRKKLSDMEASGSTNDRDLDTLRLDLSRKQRELNEDAARRKNEELDILQDRINKAVAAVAETEKYDLVFYGNLAYASNRVDLTDKVIKLMARGNP